MGTLAEQKRPVGRLTIALTRLLPSSPAWTCLLVLLWKSMLRGRTTVTMFLLPRQRKLRSRKVKLVVDPGVRLRSPKCMLLFTSLSGL